MKINHKLPHQRPAPWQRHPLPGRPECNQAGVIAQRSMCVSQHLRPLAPGVHLRSGSPKAPNTRPAQMKPIESKHEQSSARAIAPRPSITAAISQLSFPSLRENTLALRPKENVIRVPRQSATRGLVQGFRRGIVQATRFYPNLHPGAVEPIDASNIFRLNSFADQYRLHKVNSHGVNVPNQQYNFVRTSQGEMLLHARYRHPSIAQGKQVLYAGEVFFNNGQLQWWSNGSGHYQPDADSAAQANLPMDQFFSYQQIIKGEHKRKRT